MTDCRLFTGLSLPIDILANLEVLLQELEPLARIRWSPVSQLHITTKFIGTWPFSQMPGMCRNLHSLEAGAPFPVTLRGLGWFPGPNRQGWVLYVRVEPSEPLSRLAKSMQTYFAGNYRIPWEEAEYIPHVTIGRVAGNNPWPKLDERVESLATKDFGTFEALEYHMYDSAPSGYRILETFPLR